MSFIAEAIKYGTADCDETRSDFVTIADLTVSNRPSRKNVFCSGALSESLNGLHPLAKGARVSFAKGKPSVTDGPFIEAKEVLGGYWLVEAPSKEEVVKWAQRCPADEGDTIEIRQIFGPEDFAK